MSTTSKKKTGTKKSTAARNRAAMDSATKKPRITHVDIVMDDDVAEIYENLNKELEATEARLLASRPRRIAAIRAAQSPDIPPEEQAQALAQVTEEDDLELDALRRDVEEARQNLQAATQRYKFRSLGRTAWEALKERHPATDEDHEASREATGKPEDQAQWHFDTLAPELIQMASVSPRLTEEDVREIFEGEDWNDPEIAALFQAALMAQVSARQNPLARR